jgi:hypothetical protein
MKHWYLLCVYLIFNNQIFSQEMIASGQMPSVASYENGVYLVYGNGDSILYKSSTDGGKSFNTPKLIHILPGLAASHMRGPQIGVTKNGLIITVCNNAGDIFSFAIDKNANVVKKSRVNDVDTIAKENLIALASDGNRVFVTWLDLRNGHNEIYGSLSNDGGITWSKNIRIYHSPDTTVCECCKPSVVVSGNNVYVMFRNWLNGNRDLYLISSVDGGKTFGSAEKLGIGSWALKGCPMDGGGLTVDNNGINTVWNRAGKIYADKYGDVEKQIGEGRSCTIASVDGKQIYAWIENKQVVYLDHNNIKHILGKGQLPVLKAVNKEFAICIWENDKVINKAIVKI